MKTTVEVTGFLESVLSRAVEVGLARSKTDALRIGIMELNHEYKLVEDASEADLVIKKIQKVEAENKARGLKPLTQEDVFKKYPHLRKLKA